MVTQGSLMPKKKTKTFHFDIEICKIPITVEDVGAFTEADARHELMQRIQNSRLQTDFDHLYIKKWIAKRNEVL